jgi:hypothetical protein
MLMEGRAQLRRFQTRDGEQHTALVAENTKTEAPNGEPTAASAMMPAILMEAFFLLY